MPSNITEIVRFEVMRLALEPQRRVPDVPDPADNFAACVDAMLDRTEREVYGLPRTERDAYVLERARSALTWCRTNAAPPMLTKAITSWVKRMERTASATPSGRA